MKWGSIKREKRRKPRGDTGRGEENDVEEDDKEVKKRRKWRRARIESGYRG